ncbi:MAG: sigma-70 family RNA polymerase sigma factor [Gammaproteobacteria bacterium]|nr:sigma-70 family RNA polymerase sigma factor [Gammaproteobacteria bacterium]
MTSAFLTLGSPWANRIQGIYRYRTAADAGAALLPPKFPPQSSYNAAMNEGKTSATTSNVPAEQEALGALLTRMAGGDEAALAQLYDATAARAYALALRITRDTRAAEEVMSDVYFQAWQQAARYDAARGRVLAWLLTICRSRALDHLRQRDKAETHAEPDHLRPDLYRNDDSPLDLLLAFERDSRVRAALATLNDKEQQLLSLAFFQGMSHQEIAEHTHMPLGTIKSLLRRSMQALREQLLPMAMTPEESA